MPVAPVVSSGKSRTGVVWASKATVMSYQDKLVVSDACSESWASTAPAVTTSA